LLRIALVFEPASISVWGGTILGPKESQVKLGRLEGISGRTKKKEVTDPRALEKICAPARRNQFGEEAFYVLMKAA